MARGEQLGRQWMILQMLIASTDGKSVPELANKAHCHFRTVYRDLEALQIAGFPIYTEKKEGKTFWCILENAKKQAPIPFSLSELMALYFSRGLMKSLENTVFYEALESFFQKIKATLSPEYTRYLSQFAQVFSVNPKPAKDYGEFQDIIDGLNQAVVNRQVIEIDYFTMSRKARSRRRVAPYKIWFFDGTFYLIGYCYLRQDVRIFAVDRIKALQNVAESFTPPEDLDLERYMQPSFGVFMGEPVTVRIRFAAEAAGYIKEKSWHETQQIESLADGAIVLTLKVAGTDEIKFWIMKWGAQAQVLAPESLAFEIREEAAAMAKLYRS